MYVYTIFRQNLSDKKVSCDISEKKLAETSHYIPNVLRKGNPFHGPFAQLSYAHSKGDGKNEIECRMRILL